MIALIRGLLTRVGRRGPASAVGLGLPCAMCGEAATGWSIRVRDRNGSQIIDGYAVCAAHQTDAVQTDAVTLLHTKAG